MFYQGQIFIPQRYIAEDVAQRNLYDTQIKDYNARYDQYKADMDSYNQAVKEYNAGDRLEPFTLTPPSEPAPPDFTQDDIDQFEADALGRAQDRQSQLQTAVEVAQNPDQFGFSGFGFEQGGLVPMTSSPTGVAGGPAFDVMTQGIMSLQQPLSGVFPEYLSG
jgi:hypothetical protein